MLSNKVLRYIDRLLRDVCANMSNGDLPFGGKTIVLSGDWKQLGVVVEQGSRHDQICESIKSDTIFRDHFKRIRLIFNTYFLFPF